MNAWPERRYRDFLADNLGLVEAGMTPLDVEFSLPNTQGARGFVDLVARDQFGVTTLIEIKRSDASARSAMHELFKYMALFRANHGLGEHQVRAILLSTSWHELLVPFSEMLRSAPFELAGMELTIDSAGRPIGTRPVTPADTSRPLALCPKHDILLFTTSQQRDASISRVERHLGDLDVQDYFTILLDHDGSDARVIYPYCIYIVLGEFSQQQRDAIQEARFQSWRDDAREGGYTLGDEDYAERMDAENWEHEEDVFASMSDVGQSMTEIGYPDKFRKVLETWEPIKINRSGRFTSSIAWPDDAVIAGALSEGNQYTTVFTSQISAANMAARVHMLKSVDYSLMGTQRWRKEVPRLLEVLLSDEQTLSLSVLVFSPCDVLWGLSAAAQGKFGYLPSFEIVAQRKDSGARLFYGVLAWDGATRLPADVPIDVTISMSPQEYHLKRHFGAQWEDESLLCKRHGLHYEIYEDSLDEHSEKTWRIRAHKKKISRIEVDIDTLRRESAIAFVEENRRYLVKLARELILDRTSADPF